MREYLKNLIEDNPGIGTTKLEKLTKFLITPANLRVLLTRLVKSGDVIKRKRGNKNFYSVYVPLRWPKHPGKKLSMKDFFNDAPYAPYLNAGKTEEELEEEEYEKED